MGVAALAVVDKSGKSDALRRHEICLVGQGLREPAATYQRGLLSSCVCFVGYFHNVLLYFEVLLDQ